MRLLRAGIGTLKDCLGQSKIVYNTHRARDLGWRSLHRFCVVGSGPAGCYTADRLLKRLDGDASVDIIDRLPTPFGLVRSGVAPDHQHTKNVTKQFNAILSHPQVNFLGNVTLGKDISLKELRSLYHGVILAYGAESDRRLGIKGEEGPGVMSAREFVWWYNGHPDATTGGVDLSGVKQVAICGIGNVALDCARVLLQPPSRLAPTDIADYALASLSPVASPSHFETMSEDKSQKPAVEQEGGEGFKEEGGERGVEGKQGKKESNGLSLVGSIHLIARRGPAQAACTPKELKELVTELGVRVHAQPIQLAVSPLDEEAMKKSRSKKRVYDIIRQAAEIIEPGSILEERLQGESQARESCQGKEERHLHFQFYRQPVEILRDPQGRVKGLRVEVTELKQDAGKGFIAAGTGEFEELDVQMILVSIGYKSLPIKGVPFDSARGIIPNREGRVASGLVARDTSTHQNAVSFKREDAEASPGMALEWALDGDEMRGVYVCGWLKRGPSGIIGTNAIDAEETVSCLVEDLGRGVVGGTSVRATEGLLALLKERGVEVVDLTGWKRIDEAEMAEGQTMGKVRMKVTETAKLLALAKK